MEKVMVQFLVEELEMRIQDWKDVSNSCPEIQKRIDFLTEFKSRVEKGLY